MIGIPCNESARFSETYASIMGMRLPADWTNLPDGTSRMPVLQCRYASLAHSLNYIADIFMQTGYEWLFLLNDDHIFPPDTLLKLLAHDKDFVTGVYVKKQVPYSPVLYDRIEDGKLIQKQFKTGESGLIPIVGCGDGCLLIRRSVFEAIPRPWWEMATGDSPDLITQDLIFCQKVRDARIEMWADLDTTVAHIALTPIQPARTPTGEWAAVFIGGPGPQDRFAVNIKRDAETRELVEESHG